MRTSHLLPFLLLAVLASGLPARAETRVRGANVHSSVGSEIDAVPAMHLNFVRIDVVWSTVEPADGVLFWDELDRMVQTHRSRGLGIYATLGSTPKWACRQGDPPVECTCVPQDGTFGRFAKVVAARYRGAIAVYSIWNEPDLPQFFAGEPLSYVDALLIPAATAIREADPFAKIAAPELSGSFGSGARAPGLFFDAIAQRNAAGLVDIVSQHVYEETLLKGPDGILHKFYDGDVFHHSLLYWINRSVLASRDVWITEFGFEGGGDSGNGNDVRRVFELFAPRERVTALFNYELVDCGGCGNSVGLLRTNLSWKPGAEQLAREFTDLGPTPPAFRDRFDGPWSVSLWRWLLPNGGGSVADGHLLNPVSDFRAKVQDLVVTDFEISSTVQITDDLGNGFNWVGLAGRTRTPSDGGTESGYLAYLRSNGDVGLFCAKSGLNRTARSRRDPKAAPVRLTLSGSGNRIAVSVDGVEVLVERDAAFSSGYVGIQNHALGAHDDVVVLTSPLQEVPRQEPVRAVEPLAPVRHD